MADREDYYYGLIGSMLAGREADREQRGLVYEQLRERIRTRIGERGLGEDLLRSELAAFEVASLRHETDIAEQYEPSEGIAVDAPFDQSPREADDSFEAGIAEASASDGDAGSLAAAAPAQTGPGRAHAPQRRPHRRGPGWPLAIMIALLAFVAGATASVLAPAPLGIGYRHPVFDAMADEIARYDLAGDADYQAVVSLRDALGQWHDANGSYPATPEKRAVLIGQMQGEPFATFLQVKSNRDAAARLSYMSDGADYKATLSVPSGCHVYLVRAPSAVDPQRASADGSTCRAIGAWSAGAVEW